MNTINFNEAFNAAEATTPFDQLITVLNMAQKAVKAERDRLSKDDTAEIKFIDKDIHHTNRISLTNVIIQSFGEQCALAAVFTFNKSLHETLPLRRRENYITNNVLTQPGPKAETGISKNFRFKIFTITNKFNTPVWCF